MATTAKTKKPRILHVRLEEQDVAGLTSKLERAGLNPARDTSRYIRSFLRGGEGVSFLTDEQMDALKFHFSNFARVGGLLNQAVHTMNLERLKFEAGETDGIALNPKELERIIRDLHREVVETKKAVLKLTDRKMD